MSKAIEKGLSLEPKVGLVNLGDGREYGQIDEGLGLASVGLEWIAAYLEKNGVQVEIIDQSMYGLSENEVVERIVQSKADIVGLNPLSNSREICQRIIAKVKEKRPTVISIIGGYDATFNKLEHYQGIDLLIRGRGEKAMLAISQYLKNRKTPENIQGVAYRTKNGVVENIDQRAKALPLDQLPLPKRQNLEYLRESGEVAGIVTGYGCSFNCAFCQTPVMYTEGRQERPLELVLEEIDYLIKGGVKKFSIWDEDFFGLRKAEMERADQIIQYIKKQGAVITFVFITAPGANLAERRGYMPKWEGVVERLYIGVEGGCKHALNALGNWSCTRPELNQRAIQTVREYNIGLQIGFMMFNPYSTFEELTESAEFLYSNNEAANSISFFHHLRPYPETAMYNKLKENGLLIEEQAQKEIDRYVDFPYHFQHDRQSGTTKMKDFAVAMGGLSSDKRVSESDRLNNEIYMGIVRQGYGKEIFIEGDSDIELVQRYKILRKKISDLNFNFFMDSLKAFRDSNRVGFDKLQAEYLAKIEQNLPQLRQIKKHVR